MTDNFGGSRWPRRTSIGHKTDPCLYDEAFTGRARSIPRCAFCLQEDHTGQYCLTSPDHQWFGWLPSPMPAWQSTSHRAFRPQPRGQLLCPPPGVNLNRSIQEFNEGECRYTRYRYLHACKQCVTPHSRVVCPHNHAHTQGCSRSPLHFPSQATGLGPRF